MMDLFLCGAGNPEGIRLALKINRITAHWHRIVVLDDDSSKLGRSTLGVEVAGPFDMLRSCPPGAGETASLVARTAVKRWAARRRIESYGLPAATLVDPGVDVEGAELASGVVVFQYARIGAESFVGEGSAVFMGADVGHEARLGRCCVIAPNAVVNARVELGDGVYVGTNSSILPDLKIGPWATIAAGTVVTRDVPAGATVMGNPGKVVLTLELKLKMGWFAPLPPEVRRDLASHAQSGAALSVSAV